MVEEVTEMMEEVSSRSYGRGNDREECCEMLLSSEHGMLIELLEWQCLWLTAQHPYKIKPAKILS